MIVNYRILECVLIDSFYETFTTAKDFHSVLKPCQKLQLSVTHIVANLSAWSLQIYSLDLPSVYLIM